MPSDQEVADLIAAVETHTSNVHTQARDLSFNELLNMHSAEPKELDISPDYQRLFRWSPGARSRFLESLLLEMPVPPIYVVEDDDTGVYLLIDGLQRISSYLHFRGELDAPHLEQPVSKGEKLVLCDCDIIPELNGKTFDDLGTALQWRLKRAFVRLEVVRKGSDPRFKYHMFKRLNTGGELLTDQQLRNCTIRMLSAEFPDFLIELSESPEFSHVKASQTHERILGAYDQELVLRFFALKNYRDNFVHDVRDFLWEYMEGVSDPSIGLAFDLDTERDTFKKTFAVFEKAMEDRAFGRANKNLDKVGRSFSIYHFEALTMGIQSSLAKLDPENIDQMSSLKDVVTGIKLSQEFVNLTTGGGKNSPGPLRDRIGFAQQRIEEAI